MLVDVLLTDVLESIQFGLYKLLCKFYMLFCTMVEICLMDEPILFIVWYGLKADL